MPSTALQPFILRRPPIMETWSHIFPPPASASKATQGVLLNCRGLGWGLRICISNKLFRDAGPICGPHFQSSHHLFSPILQMGKLAQSNQTTCPASCGQQSQAWSTSELFLLHGRHRNNKALVPALGELTTSKDRSGPDSLTGASPHWSCCPGAELPAGLAVPAEVEDHHPGLHPVTPCRQHAQEEPGGVQHAGG